jgi:hypothetical protein
MVVAILGSAFAAFFGWLLLAQARGEIPCSAGEETRI